MSLLVTTRQGLVRLGRRGACPYHWGELMHTRNGGWLPGHEFEISVVWVRGKNIFVYGKMLWRSIVWKKIQDREQVEWRKRMDNKPKLRTYRVMKRELETEKYLDEGTAQQRRVMVMMRGGTNDLRIETGRYEKLGEQERICIFCESGEVEDERHFLCRCEAWKEEREAVLREVRKLGVTMADEEVMFVNDVQEVEGKGRKERTGGGRSF